MENMNNQYCSPVGDSECIEDCWGWVWIHCSSCYSRGIRERIPTHCLDGYGCYRQDCEY